MWSFLLQAQGRSSSAREKMNQAVEQARSSNITWMTSNVAASQARLALQQGNLESAERWAETCGLDVGDELGINRLGEYTTLARIRLAQGRAEESADLLSWLQDFITPLGLTGWSVEVKLLQSLVHQELGDQTQAVGILALAVTQAAPGGYIRLFLDEGAPLRRLLHQVTVDEPSMIHYLSRLRRAFDIVEEPGAAPQTQAILDPLSDREIEVLRLLAANLSSAEIAEELTIAVSTVRTHRKNIYGKLDVHSRYEAVVRAGELELL